MSVVVCDTGPIQYLILCGAIDFLPKLFGEVIIPEAVLAELRHPNAPEAVKSWIRETPKWISIRRANLIGSITGLGQGEVEAIELALTLPDGLLLVDDEEARNAATQLGLAITGTVGVLAKAATAGLIDVEDAVARLRKTTFFLTDELADWLLRKKPRN